MTDLFSAWKVPSTRPYRRLRTVLLLLLFLPLLPHRALAQHSISGTIFADVNYGGGAGRNYNTANNSATASGFAAGSIRRPGARVELYDNTGTFVAAAITDSNGSYTFAGLTGTNYTVRVVNRTVSAARPGYSSSLIGVQTFRTDNGAEDVNRVGGENPAVADAGSNASTVVTSDVTGNNINLAFTGLKSSGDNTLFLDNVQVLQGGTPLATNPIVNPDFENGTLVANGGTYQYNPSGTDFGWTFSPSSGIETNGSAFTPPNTTSNTRAGFVQSAGGTNGSISQTFSLPAGTYTLSFLAANRVFGGQQAINITVNGFVVRGNLQATVGSYAIFTTDNFTVGPDPGAALLSDIPAQSVAPVTIGSADVTGVDFGFNFDTVVNTNNSGQGSLRQFVLNSNLLTNTSLQQDGNRVDATGAVVALPTINNEESSIFMIPDNTGTPGLRANVGNGLNGTANGGANQWASIQITSTLTITTDQYTVVDGTTQTANVGDSNKGKLGAGGANGQFPTVGTQQVAFAQFNRPEVEVFGLNNTTGFDAVLLMQAPNTTVRGLSVHGGNKSSTAASGSITVGATFGMLVENNLVGINPFRLSSLNPNLSSYYGISMGNGANLGVIVQRNLVAYASNSGIYVPSGGTGAGSSISITDNELVQNGFRIAGGDNITLGTGGATGPANILSNLIRSANSDGVQFEIGNTGINGVGYNTVQNNTFFDNGNGGSMATTLQSEGAAILYLQRTGTATGTNPDIISNNIIRQTQASGIVVGYGQRRIRITQNSTYFNGTPFNSPTGGNLGIDLIPQSSYYLNSTGVGKADYGNGDGVTPNTGSVTTTYGNSGMNYPVFTLAKATLTGTTVTVAGYVGNPNVTNGTSIFKGATVEIYTADNVPPNNNGAVLTGDGQRIAHGEGRSYLGTLTANNNGRFNGTITLPANTPPLTGAAISGYITATAYLAAYGTSEFGPNRPVLALADVQATIAGNGPVNAGDTGQFTVVISNLSATGSVQATGVVATVQLPTNLSNVTVTNGSYNAATGLVTFNNFTAAAPGMLGIGVSRTFTITYKQPLAEPVTATASISTATNEAGQTANNTDTDTNTTNPLYNLTTAISGPTTVTAGNEVAYVVTSTNQGSTQYPSPASTVTQTVSVPAGAANLYVTGGGVITGSSSAGYTITYTTALAAGQSESQTVAFTAPTTDYTVDAAISGDPADQVDADNTVSTGTVTVNAATSNQANVYVRVSPTAPTVAAGATGTFTVREGNRGPSAAQGVQTTVVLPPGLSNVVVADSTSGPIAGAYDPATGLVTLPAVANQPTDVPSRKTYTISFTAPASGGTVTATAVVGTISSDRISTDNQATAQITVPGITDLVVQLAGPTTATVGEQLTYTFTTLDNGPAAAQNVMQTASLPAGLPVTGTNALLVNGNSPTSVSTTSGVSIATYGAGNNAITYNQSTGQVVFPALAMLDQGSSTVNSFSFQAPTNGNVSLSASTSASNSIADTNPNNNSASVITMLRPVFDVQVLLNGPGQVEPGNPVLLEVTTRNNGPSTVSNVRTTVNIPTGLATTGSNPLRINGKVPTGVNGTVATYPDGSTYDSSTGTVTLPNSGALSATGTASVVNTIGFVLPANYTGTLAASATATPLTTNGLADDTQPNSNVVTYQPVLVPANGDTVDLQTTLSSANSATAGGPLTFTLSTTSNGSSSVAATGVLQYVQLAPGLTTTGTVTVTQDGTAIVANYDNLSGLLTLPSVSSLAIGSTLRYSIAVSNVPGNGPLVATASVSSNETDTLPANNVSMDIVTITPLTGLVTTIVGPSSAPAGTRVTYSISSANTGTTATTGTSQTVQVPTAATNVLLNGVAVTPDANGNVTVPLLAALQPGTANTINNTLSFTAPGAAGTSFAVNATLSATGPGTVTSATASQTTTIAGPAPLALDIVNTLQAPQGNTTNKPLPILPLVAVTQGGTTISSYTIQSLPTANQGTLFVFNGTTNVPVSLANFPGLVLTPAQAQNLSFRPFVSGFVGNATFTYTATDNMGVASNLARYLIPIAPDRVSVSSFTPAKGGNTSYSNGDVLAYVIDINGATYTTSATIYDRNTGQLVATTADNPISNGLPTTSTNAVLAANGPSQNPGNTLPGGVSLNPITGQIYVSDRTQLPAITTLTDYYVNVVTTDVYGGTNTVTERFQLGAYPLPVELTRFEAATQATDAVLTWTTASELNNDYFDVERSLDGTSFTAIARVAGQGSKVSATSYRSLDRGIGRQVSGPVYYRLKQVDLNGTIAYSSVRTVTFAAQAAELSLFPNPARQSTTLDLGSLPTGTYEVTLTNVLGQTVRTFTQAGGSSQLLDVSELPSGNYQLRVTGTTDTGSSLVQVKRLTKD